MRIGTSLRSWNFRLVALFLIGLTLGIGAIHARDDDDRDERGEWGAVFTLTNDHAGNELAVFVRDAQGKLVAPVLIPTGGLGTGGGLGNQGAIALGSDSQYLYAVNPGSNTITVFQLGRNGPRAIQVISSGGKLPISLTINDELLYVLNAGGSVAGGTDSIAGFDIGENGKLTPKRNSVAGLSAVSTGPAQISFSPSGEVLVVTEKATNTITLFGVNNKGLPTARKSVASKGQTPFGFGFPRGELLVVSEAFGGGANASAVSSYRLDEETSSLRTISASVPTTETAACWIASTANGKFTYAANTGSRSVTGFQIGDTGKLSILNADGVTALTGATPTDLTILGNGVLYVLNNGAASVGVYSIDKNGALTAVQPGVAGLPLTHPTGLVVR